MNWKMKFRELTKHSQFVDYAKIERFFEEEIKKEREEAVQSAFTAFGKGEYELSIGGVIVNQRHE